MIVLSFRFFAVQAGSLRSQLSIEAIHETARRAHGIILAASQPPKGAPASDQQVGMTWNKSAITVLDFPERDWESSISAPPGQRQPVIGRLKRHPIFANMPANNLIDVFFIWRFTAFMEDKVVTEPAGITLNSRMLMVEGRHVGHQDRGLALAHEIGHALLGTHPGVHSQQPGNLMFGSLAKVGSQLDPDQRRVFVANAARVAAGERLPW